MKIKKPHNIIFLFFFSALFVVSACKKDKPCPSNCGKIPDELLENTECYNFPMPPQAYFSSEDYMYKQPCFNPNNQNEFVYYLQDNVKNSCQLVKYNIQTKQKIVLYESSNHKIAGQPKWSRKGWIAFTQQTNNVNHIFVVKDNGDSLRQFTQSAENDYPAWDANGESLYWSHTPVSSTNSFFLKKGLYGADADTVLIDDDVDGMYLGDLKGTTHNEVSNNGVLFAVTSYSYSFNSSYSYLSRADLNESPIGFSIVEPVDLNGQSPFKSLSSISCINDDELYLAFSEKGLYKLNINNNHLSLLIPFCKSKRYETISYSADGDVIVGERVDSRLELDEEEQPTGVVLEKSTIWLIDSKTLKESKLEL